jgi:3-oxoacyl-[acyl-carrier protein] reductase
MSDALKGRVAIITGAGRGIGRATALSLAQAGADLVLAARTVAELEEVASTARALGRRALAVPTDVRDEAQVEALVHQAMAQLGRVDILVNNAGATGRRQVAELGTEEWARVLDTNTTGTFLVSRAVVPLMRERRWGRIVNVVSGNGRQGQANAAAYSASKFAVMGFSQSLAQEVRDDNITVTCVLPGPADTAMRAASTPNEDKSLLLRPEDVAEVILFVVTRPDYVVISEIPVRPRVYMGGVA